MKGLLSDNEVLLSEARDEIVALLEVSGLLSQREIGSRLTVQISDDQLAGCLMYLCVEGRIERPTRDYVAGAVNTVAREIGEP